MIRKGVQMIAWIITIAVLLTACGTKQLQGQKGTSSNKVSNKPIELSFFMVDGDGAFDEEWQVFKKAEEITNVKLKGYSSKSTTDDNQAFNLMMASGKVADVVRKYGRNEINKYAQKGAFIPLNNLIDQYAPNIKAFLDKNLEIKKFVTSDDGNIYFIPYIRDAEKMKASTGWFIRTDWLVKLGVNSPQTVDELYTVLKAFKENDPNGNGQKDEIPYFSREAKPGFENSISCLLPLWDAHKEWYLDGDTIKYGPMQPEYKEAYKTIAKWYKEGLIDKEIYTRGGKARDELLNGNLGGLTHDWFGSTADYNTKLKTSIPEFQFMPIAPMTNTKGKKVTYFGRDNVDDVGCAIATSNKHQVETIKYLDFWFSKEGRRLANFGVEGKQYNMVDGKPIFNDSVLKGEKSAVNILQSIGAQRVFSYQQDFDYEAQWLNPIALKGMKEYVDNKYIIDQMPKLNLTVEEEQKMVSLMKNIDTYRMEKAQKWALGGENVEESFENSLQQFKNLNIDQAIEIYQNAYKRYKAIK